MHQHRRLLTLGLLASFVGVAMGAEVDLPRYPAISPDGERVTFTWRGDLWIAGANGGNATRLTRHSANEYRTAWSPDGSWIAFESDRDGYLNLYVMRADGTDVRQVTFEDSSCVMTGFGPDGKELFFQSFRESDAYREPRPYRVSVAGGPIRRVHDAHGRSPRLSPDGSKLAFVRGGSAWSRRHYRGPASRDVWLHDPTAGTFRQLTTWSGNDGKVRWADGDTIYYLSDREGDTLNVHALSIGGGAPTTVTSFRERDVIDFDVAPTGRLVFHSWDKLYVQDGPGATPRALTLTTPDDAEAQVELLDVSRKVTEAALSPDGKVMAYVAYGDVYVRNVDDRHPTRRVTTDVAREQGITWSPDGLRLYFVSDRSGTESIYTATVALTRGEVVETYEERTSPPKPEPEPETEEAKPDEAKPEGTEPGDAPKTDEPKTDEDPAEPTEGDDEPEKKPAEPKKDAEKKEPEQKDPALDPTRWHDALAFTIEPLIVADTLDRHPSPSPDGRKLLFQRGSTLVVHDLVTREERTVVDGWDRGMGWSWSPDSRHVAYSQDDRNFNSEILVVPVDGSGPPQNVSRHPRNDFNPRWSADGKVLVFVSERYDREYDVYRVHLDRALDGYSRLELEAYYEETKKAAKKLKPLAPLDLAKLREEASKPDTDTDTDEAKKDEGEAAKAPEPLDLDDAYLRLTRLTRMSGNEISLAITPAGDRIVTSGTGDNAGLHSIAWDGSGAKKIAGSGSLHHLDLAGGKAIVVAGGQAQLIPVAGGAAKTISMSERIELDRAAESSQKFMEAARTLGELFYHPDMKGLDWERLTADYHELASRAHTTAEFDFVASLMLGELNASHLGITSPRAPAPLRQPNGYLGIDVTPVDGGFRIDRVLPYGPADRSKMKLAAGDVVVAVDDVAIRPTDAFGALFEDRVGEETLVTVRRALGDGTVGEVRLLVTPQSGGAERQLRYDTWTRERAALVDEWSNGRLGYIHIRGMNQSSLRDFERDLYAAGMGRDGIVLDVRNNGGGSTADLLLASIMVQPHAYTVPRGADPAMRTGYPQDRLFIPRYVAPMNLLCNEKSFSNAEIFSHAFKQLDRGTLVGVQTYGGVISTGRFSLIDGTGVRAPFRGWYLLDGTDMENNGAIPDLIVPRNPSDEVAGEDRQLRMATEDLMRRLD